MFKIRFIKIKIIFCMLGFQILLSGYQSLGDTHVENACKIFVKGTLFNIVEVYRLVQLECVYVQEFLDIIKC